MTHPYFSIIIPFFNRRNTIGQTLNTLELQRFRDFEVILIDDGSTDCSAEYITSVYSDYNLILQKNSGPGMARNAGLKLAKGQYIVFLDSDDLLFPWTLEVYFNLISKQGEPSVLLGRMLDFSKEEELDYIAENPMQFRVFNDVFSSSSEPIIFGCGNIIVKRNCLDAVCGFHHERVNAEDIELLLRLGTDPGFVVMDAPVTVGYRRHSVSETGNCAGFKRVADGICLIVEREKRAVYPGGRERKRERLELICRYARWTAISCRKMRLWNEAFCLYRKTFFWQWALGRIRFLVGFWVIF